MDHPNIIRYYSVCLNFFFLNYIIDMINHLFIQIFIVKFCVFRLGWILPLKGWTMTILWTMSPTILKGTGRELRTLNVPASTFKCSCVMSPLKIFSNQEIGRIPFIFLIKSWMGSFICMIDKSCIWI